MAFFKRIQKKVNNLWYPQSVTWGKAVTTREVADELSGLSTAVSFKHLTLPTIYPVEISVVAVSFKKKKKKKRHAPGAAGT